MLPRGRALRRIGPRSDLDNPREGCAIVGISLELSLKRG